MTLTLSKLLGITFTILAIGIATMLSYKIDMVFLPIGIGITFGSVIFLYVVGWKIPKQQTEHFRESGGMN